MSGPWQEKRKIIMAIVGIVELQLCHAVRIDMTGMAERLLLGGENGTLTSVVLVGHNCQKGKYNTHCQEINCYGR